MIQKITGLLMLLVLLASCAGGGPDVTRDSKGKPYELFVITTTENWEGPLGDSLRKILAQNVEMLVQDEPRFDVFTLTRDKFRSPITEHRNLIVLNVGEPYPQGRISADFDVNAQPQLIMTIQGPSVDSVAQLIHDNRNEILQVFEISERNRFVNRAEQFRDVDISKAISDLFGFRMIVPRGYKIRSTIEPDFMWISHELPVVSQGIVIYTYPFTGSQDITPETLIERRNEFVSRIPGPSDGSYMGTSVNVIPPEYKRIKIADRYWAEMKGQWNVVNDFMGGPFVSYSTLNREKNQVVTIDFYVFSPKYGKRNYIKQLESLLFSVRFPEDQTFYSTASTRKQPAAATDDEQ